MDEKLQYSENGLQNRVLFLSKSNDINIIVEDEGKEFEYEQIFERLLGNEIKINHIFPMKGKPGVIKAFNKYGISYENKECFYIVDGDFDLIMDKKEIDNSHFIYLKNYNIEGYYVDKNAVLSFVAGKMKKTKKELKQMIDLDEWEIQTTRVLVELFICFMIIQDYCPTKRSIGAQSEYFYIEENTGLFSYEKVSNYINDEKKDCLNYDTLYIKYLEKYNTLLNKDPYRIICGKYLLRGLDSFIRKQMGKQINFRFEDFKFYLISTFDIKKLDYLKKQILSNLI